MIVGRRPLVPEILSQIDRVGAKFEQAAITPKRFEIGCQLLLITKRNETKRTESFGRRLKPLCPIHQERTEITHINIM